jgi:hypothetical protein
LTGFSPGREWCREMPRGDGKRRPPGRRSGAPKTTNTTIVRPSSDDFTSPVNLVIDRLEGVRRSGRGWVGRCPAHDDRFPSLSVTEAHDGRVLLHDFAGCAPEQIVAGIGLTMADLFPPGPDDWRTSRPRRRVPAKLPREVVRGLLWRREFAVEWEIAKMLAVVPPAVAKRDLLAGWHFLQRLDVDVAFVWRSTTMIRGLGFFAFCDADRAEPADIARAVRRLVRRVEQEAVAE